MLNAGVQENALPARADAVVQCRIMPDETVAGTQATLEKVAGRSRDQGLGRWAASCTAPESPPTPAVLGSIESVVHAMWPGMPVIPAMAAGASDSIYTRSAGIPSYGVGGAWEDIDDVRAHGRDERRKQDSFYESVEFTYRLMKEMGGAKTP